MIWTIFYESSFVTYHRLEWDNGEQGRRDIEMINGGVDWNWSHPEMSFYILQSRNANFFFELY